MALRISVQVPAGWSRTTGEDPTWIKDGHEKAGRLRLSSEDVAEGVEPIDAGVQVGRRAGWGTPLNLGEAECEYGKLAFVSFFGGPFPDARLWIVVSTDGSAVVFKWTGEEAVGDEAEVIVLRTLGLVARPRSVFFGG